MTIHTLLDPLKELYEYSYIKEDVTEEEDPCWDDYHMVGMKNKNGKKVPNCVPKESVNKDTSDNLLSEYAVDAKGHKSSTGGLTKKGRDSYNKKNGSHLQAPVTTKPSKLKKDSKPAKRRKSFCARMSGVKGPMKKPNGKPTRKALALRKWNC